VVIQTLSTTAQPSGVTSRKTLIYFLSRAAKSEHDLACIYLFTAFSPKSSAVEGKNDNQVVDDRIGERADNEHHAEKNGDYLVHRWNAC
jgi:hypothetical protein